MSDYLDKYMDAAAEADEKRFKERQAKAKVVTDADKAIAEGVMSKAAAVEITDSIRAAATATYILVKRAHDGKAWKSLGYDTWEAYVTKEFDMTTSRSYQLINQANVIEKIEEVTPEGTKVLLTEKEARDIKNELPRITEKVLDATKNVTPDEAAKKVSSIVSDTRKEKKEEADAKKAEKADGVQEDSFQGLDAGKKAPRADRLSESQSGSTVDLDADVDGAGVDADFSEPTVNDDSNEDAVTLQFIFSSVSTLGNPYDVAKSFSGDNKLLAKNVKNAIEWLTKFQKFI